MARQRLSRLQLRILGWLEAEYDRTRGTVSPGNQELVRALANEHYQSISRSLKNLEQKGYVTVGRTPGGQAEYVNLTRKP